MKSFDGMVSPKAPSKLRGPKVPSGMKAPKAASIKLKQKKGY
jgi:hypothetical protein